MRKRSSYLLLWMIAGMAGAQECVLPSSPPPDRSRVVFILDTSGSMQGLGDGKANIFSKVQKSIVEGMQATQAPGSVEVLTFDKGPRERFSFSWPSEQTRFEQSIGKLKADGSNTWLYASMDNMFSSLKSQDDTATTVYVITDGFDNDPDKSHTIRTALDTFNVSRGPFDKLYYIALAADVPPEVQQAFADTTYAQFIRLALNHPPDFTASNIAPGLVNVKDDGSFAFKRPAQSTLELASSEIGGAQVSIINAQGQGDRVQLKIDGSVPAGAVGYMCARLPQGTQNILLRFQRETPRPKAPPKVKQEVLGTLKLQNPDAKSVLKRGESTTWRYKAVGGPVTVEVAEVPPDIEAKLPDQTVSLNEGEIINLNVTDKTLSDGQQAAPTLKLNDSLIVKVPPVTGRIPKPFPWYWLLLLLIPPPLFLWWRRERRPLDPYALSIDKTLRVSVHDRAGWKATRIMRKDVADVGQLFKLSRLQGLTLERFKPDIAEEDEVILDNSNLESIRRYTAQQVKRDVKLQAQPELLRLQKGEETGNFLVIDEVLKIGQLYLFTDIKPPPARVRATPLAPEPPIEVIVSFLDGAHMQELELPLDDVDLADIFGHPALRGLVVRREPGLFRLRNLAQGMIIRHISRTFVPGEALPLAVMLNLTTLQGEFQIRIRDKASMERYQR